MTDFEKQIADKVFQLLLGARAVPDNRALSDAEREANYSTTIRDRDQFRQNAILAIQTAKMSADHGQPDADELLNKARQFVGFWRTARS